MQRMILGLDIRASHFNAFWRLPETDLSALYDFETYKELARAAETVSVHFLFDADALAVENLNNVAPRIFEPTTYFSALAAVTSKIGLLPTYSTTFNEPFNLARKIASLDHLSKGRAGWNLVTTGFGAAAANFGLADLPNHDERYDRAAEFVEILQALWTSWDRDAVAMNKATGRFVDPDKVHAINFKGKYYEIRGPLTTFRPPQGWPVLSQAGESETGRQLASKYANLVYTRQRTIDAARNYRADLNERAVHYGRPANSIRVIQAIFGAVAATTAEAQDHVDRISRLAPEGAMLQRLERWFGVDLGKYADDDPLPPVPPVESSNNYQTHILRLHQQIKEEGLRTVGDLIRSTKRREAADLLVGSVKDVADYLEEWFVTGAVDGFILGHGDHTKYGVKGIIDLLIPELQRRKLFRTEYSGSTFRENLGLENL